VELPIRLVHRDQTMPYGEGDRICPPPRSDLAVDVGDVVFHGAHADDKLGSDFPVAPPGREQAHDFDFA
jgi:hypothetical protein